MKMDRVRASAVAGMFYPGDAHGLRTLVEEFLGKAPPVQSDPVAMVAPHAGFVYSGYTAACAYKGLDRAPANAPRRVFLLGPSHRVWLEGASVGNYDAYMTPLGRVDVDREAIGCLASRLDVTQEDAPQKLEHSLETQLPFLQMTLVNFRIVPIVYGEMSGGHLADLLELCWRPGDLIVASTDLSHYHDYEQARQLDAKSNQAVLTTDPKSMESCEACGKIGVQALLEFARRRKWRPVLTDLRNSGDTAGDKQRVVGYASYLLYPEAAVQSGQKPDKSVDAQVLPVGEAKKPFQVVGKEALPSWVREHLSQILRGQSGLSAETMISRWSALAKPGACFVTLKADGDLRGCIGTLSAHRSLGADLLENGVSAAIRDPRFPPLTGDELPDVEIEVSILSAPEPLLYRDGEDLLHRLRPGVHGVILTQNGHRATFLPQVWEQLPNPRDFLDHLCRKAGLTGSCWRQGVEIQVYTVDKIMETP